MSGHFVAGLTLGYFFYEDVELTFDLFKSCFLFLLESCSQNCKRKKTKFIVPSADLTFKAAATEAVAEAVSETAEGVAEATETVEAPQFAETAVEAPAKVD